MVVKINIFLFSSVWKWIEPGSIRWSIKNLKLKSFKKKFFPGSKNVNNKYSIHGHGNTKKIQKSEMILSFSQWIKITWKPTEH